MGSTAKGFTSNLLSQNLDFKKLNFIRKNNKNSKSGVFKPINHDKVESFDNKNHVHIRIQTARGMH